MLAAALACLFLLLLFAGTLAHTLVLRQRTAGLDGARHQCLWLAEAAAARAVVQLRTHAAYSGETWRVQLSPLSDGLSAGSLEGSADIRVVADPDTPGGKRIQVIAHWNPESVYRVVHQLEMQLPPTE